MLNNAFPYQFLSQPHTEFFEQLYPILIAKAYTFSRSKADAEDLVQDLILHLLSKKVQFERISNLSAYLYITMRNIDISRRRKKSEAMLIHGQKIEIASLDTSIKSFEDEDFFSITLNLLSEKCGLTEPQYELLSYTIKGYKPSQIVELFDWNLEDIRREKQNYRRKIRKAIKEDLLRTNF